MALFDFFRTALDIAVGPCHLVLFSTLLGTQLWHSFVVATVAFRALPRPAFIGLQKKLFPLYFRAQTALLVLTAATFPRGVGALARSWSDWLPFAVAALPTILNLAVYGPRTREIMIERAQLGVRDTDKATTTSTTTINKRFSRAHAMSIHLNLFSIGATLWYGWRLASRMHFD
ncbi:Xanthocillin biosynthesis cluster protein D [Paramyrothecium foliicola]|nr:Xanthocillin biosynthesis cluster protein D [Paramyrothecium foliicola]